MELRLYGILIPGWLASCTSPAPGKSEAVPDHFDDNLNVMMRAVAHPCGADVDTDGDGKIDVHYTYTYDPLGRSLRDVGVDLTGALYEQIDYTWDNAGHLIHQRDILPMFEFVSDDTSVYDTLGRRTRFHDESGTPDVPETSTTIDYSNFDELGHSTHGDQLYKDLTDGTSQRLSRAYGYDDLGRRISLDVHFEDTGDLFQGWQHTYDDVAHMVTTHLNEPLSLRRAPGITLMDLDTYDADAHWLSRHSVLTPLGGTRSETTDTVIRWDGDRELSMTSTRTGDGIPSRTTTTAFKYQCDSARLAADHLPASALAIRVSPARPATALHRRRAGR